MAKRDPNKTARNKRIAAMKDQLRALLPKVLKETGLDTEASLNAKIGSKADEFIDLKNEVITSPEHYASLYLDGFQGSLSTTGFRTSFDEMYDLFNGSKAAQEYMLLFLERSYLKHFDELSKRRPSVEEAAIWIGQNSADYGLLVAPRFATGDWQNDRSEIRAFKPGYWTIGHVVETGLVIPGKNKRMTFADPDAYLDFFENVLVRHSRSPHQIKLAEQYSAYVRAAANPLAVPLLIPELRYEGQAVKHRYRLDFCVIDPVSMQKTGFELSPWSTHGELTGTKGKTQKEINAEASANFEKEMKKHKQYFKKHGIFALIYTDSDLADIDGMFADIEDCLPAPRYAPPCCRSADEQQSAGDRLVGVVWQHTPSQRAQQQHGSGRRAAALPGDHEGHGQQGVDGVVACRDAHGCGAGGAGTITYGCGCT